MSNFIKIKCNNCQHEFRKKCKEVCVWQSEKSRFYDMFGDDEGDGYIGEGIYLSDMFPDDDDDDDDDDYDDDFDDEDFEERKLYDDCGKLLPQYKRSQCPSCSQVFWFQKVDKIEKPS